MSNPSRPNVGRHLRVAALRASIGLGTLAVSMGRTRSWMVPADRTALRDLERRRLPAMKDELRRLEALA